MMKTAGRILFIILETLLLLVLAVYMVLFVIMRGPSETARNLMVRSLKESSALKFVPSLCLSQSTIDGIMTESTTVSEYTHDTSLVNIATATESEDGADEWGLIDEDGDGIILEEVRGSTYTGYMMIVKDPSRVIVGCTPFEGHEVGEYVEMYGAVAGINGGGFEDDGGMGDGSTPDSIVVSEGKIVNEWAGTKNSFVGIDENYNLRVDCQTGSAIEEAGIVWGCGYGPILINNGKIVVSEEASGGLNPRTAIGQRSDGAILLLVIDGRHVASLGASYMDEAEVMLRYGAVNAANMDGGSSSLMYYNGEYVNNEAFVIGIRDIPTTWLVMPEGWTYEK